MTDRENELTIGTDRDGEPFKVSLLAEEEENAKASELSRYWENANAQSGHGKSNLPAAMLREMCYAGRLAQPPQEH